MKGLIEDFGITRLGEPVRIGVIAVGALWKWSAIGVGFEVLKEPKGFVFQVLWLCLYAVYDPQAKR
jgi:hypothetical protein